jgi:hypothetical protein
LDRYFSDGTAGAVFVRRRHPCLNFRHRVRQVACRSILTPGTGRSYDPVTTVRLSHRRSRGLTIAALMGPHSQERVRQYAAQRNRLRRILSLLVRRKANVHVST